MDSIEYVVVYWEDDIRMESGIFTTWDAAESWMNNNLDNTIKHAYIDQRDVKSWSFVYVN